MKKKKLNRILLAGPSGVGKTTVANFIAELGYNFISGSVSDLLPQTKEMTHSEMLARDSHELYMEDFQILSLRNRLFSKEEEPFVSDRSFLDSAAYFIYKQADKIPSCEIEHFLELAKMALVKTCDCLIFFKYSNDMFDNWVIEDNSKRVTNKYFQMEISNLMEMVLGIWGIDIYRKIPSIKEVGDHWFNYRLIDLKEEISIGTISSLYGNTKVLIIPEANQRNREIIIEKSLNGKL